MKQSISTLLDEVVNKLTGKIKQQLEKNDDKNFLKNMTAFKKVIDTMDKLILLNEKLNILKSVEHIEEETLDETEKSIMENYFKARLKSPLKSDHTSEFDATID